VSAYICDRPAMNIKHLTLSCKALSLDISVTTARAALVVQQQDRNTPPVNVEGIKDGRQFVSSVS
jgi:hypothetical protein